VSFIYNFSSRFYFLIFILIIIFSIFIFYSFSSIDSSNLEISTSDSSNDYYFSSSSFYWPVPGYHTITCNFGPRVSPTTGASTNHSGIDIAAPEGTTIYSISNGIVSYTGFNGANGCTIKIENSNITVSYSHVSPQFIVSVGENISANQKIAVVGPKILYGIPNNKYTDSNGNPTNGATTGCHLHLTIKKDGIAVNPLNYFN
jgi:murein DD-endopeptidase MepM/ murein hydrolase activator NlpD